MDGLGDLSKDLDAIVSEYLQWRGLHNTLMSFESELATLGRKRISSDHRLIKTEILKAFDTGDRASFVALWESYVPASNRSLSFEFKFQLYFAIYPQLYRPLTWVDDSKLSMLRFREYVELHGASLAGSPETLPYLALHLVKNPESHLTFRDLFRPVWREELRRSLNTVVDTMPESVVGGAETRLARLYRASLMEHPEDSNRKYDELLEMSKTILSTLQGASQGTSVPVNVVENYAHRLALLSNGDITGFVEVLDFESLKTELQSSDDAGCALLLQALRWRVLNADAVVGRREWVLAYLTNDLFQVTRSPSLIAGLLSRPAFVVEQFGRMLNLLVSCARGRSYFLSSEFSSDILHHIILRLMAEKGDTVVRRSLLGALQKLSLRRKAQDVLIAEDVIAWLCSVFTDLDSLSPYSVEYGTALLMNLSLRFEGRTRCDASGNRLISVLMDMLEYEDIQVRTYVNGVFYSILTRQAVRDRAASMGLGDLLSVLITKSSDQIAQQLNFVMQQLTSDAPEEADAPEVDDESADADDEEEEFDDEIEEEPIEIPDGGRGRGETLLSRFSIRVPIREGDRPAPMQPAGVPQLMPPAAAATASGQSPQRPYAMQAQSQQPPLQNSQSAYHRPEYGVPSQPYRTSNTNPQTSNNRPPLRPSTPKYGPMAPAPQQQQQHHQQQHPGAMRPLPPRNVPYDVLPGPSERALRSVRETSPGEDPLKEYQQAFITRQKIPRTPANDSFDL